MNPTVKAVAISAGVSLVVAYGLLALATRFNLPGLGGSQTIAALGAGNAAGTPARMN